MASKLRMTSLGFNSIKHRLEHIRVPPEAPKPVMSVMAILFLTTGV